MVLLAEWFHKLELQSLCSFLALKYDNPMTSRSHGMLNFGKLARAGKMPWRLLSRLYRRFFPDASEAEAREFAEEHHAETMAEFQGLLLALEQEFAELESILVRG